MFAHLICSFVVGYFMFSMGNNNNAQHKGEEITEFTFWGELFMCRSQ